MEFGLSGLRTTDFGRKGQDLVIAPAVFLAPEGQKPVEAP